MQRFLASFVFILVFPSIVFSDTHLVLPFFNLSDSSNLDWIGESISESVRETLTGQGLLVVDRDDRTEVYRRLSVRPYVLLTRASVVKIAETLDADHVVYGDFRVTPPPEGQSPIKGSLQITARSIDIRRLRKGPELSEIGTLEDLASLQAHLSWQALRFLMPKSAPSEEVFRATRKRVRVEAIENYIRGMVSTDSAQKQRYFSLAVQLDPSFSQPCFQLGRMLYQSNDKKGAADWLKRVPESDPNYREARFFLGLSLYSLNDFPGAETAFQTVAAVVPLNEVLNNLGAAQNRRNEPEAVATLERALEGDTGDPDYQFNVGYALWKRGRFAEAATRFRAVLERDPDDDEATAFLGRCIKQAGPRPGDSRSDGRERLKDTYQEAAWWQLKAMLEKK